MLSDRDETLGVLAHPGGLVVDRPELTVGVVRAVSRPTGVELELLARRPLDRRDAAQRQADIRAGRGVPAPAPRHLLPAADEGVDLRVGWLDGDGRAHWEYGSVESSSGDPADGVRGPYTRTTVRFPPVFDRVSVVLAWPEIGFPETVLDLALPDRATVDRAYVSVWDAPVDTGPVPDGLEHRAAAFPAEEPAVETGRIAVGPRVLHRGPDAVVVLHRLTVVGDALALEIGSVARRAAHVDRTVEVAIVRAGAALWLPPHVATSTGGRGTTRTTAEYVVDGPVPPGGVLPLVVAWPAAGLVDACVDLPLGGPE